MTDKLKKKILQEIKYIPANKIPQIMQILHLFALYPGQQPRKPLSSLKGIWQGSAMPERIFQEAEHSLFPYEK